MIRICLVDNQTLVRQGIRSLLALAEGIEVTGFRVPAVRFSDHLPLVCDFEVRERATSAAA